MVEIIQETYVPGEEKKTTQASKLPWADQELNELFDYQILLGKFLQLRSDD